jgi:transcriptional regulator with XRE-family HTH domain
MHSLGISGKELSVQIAVPEATVSRWRSGVRLPHKSKIVLLADFFRVEPKAMTESDGIEFHTSENSAEHIRENECRELLQEILHRAAPDPKRLNYVRNQLRELLQRIDGDSTTNADV